jgi:hypothetical protein
MWKTFISRHILHQSWYTCSIALSVRRNRQHRSLLTVTSGIQHLVGHHLRLSYVFERISRLSCEPLYAQTLPTINRKYILINSRCIEFPFSQKTHTRMLLFGRTHLKHGRRFDHWNRPLNLRMRVCYLKCHEARLCCYLVMNIEKLLYQLHLFYFHL